jgi:signal peptidase I
MKPAAVPYWAVLAVGILSVVWFFTRFEFHKFEDPESKQFLRPQILPDQWRRGTAMTWAGDDALRVDDVVRFRSGRSHEDLTSRVVALAGQRVKITEGVVFVDGEEVEDVYKRNFLATDWVPEVIVPEGCVFLLNDMRNLGSDQHDSRFLGPVPIAAITYRFAPQERKAGGLIR